jgi:hypothetical protein
MVAGPGTTFSAPGIAVRTANPEGEADIVAQGPNNSLMYYHATPGYPWSTFMVAGPGTTLTAPAIAVQDDPFGLAVIVAMGPTGTLMYYHATPGYPWTLLGGPGGGAPVPGIITSAPSIAVGQSGFTVVAQGLDAASGPGNWLLYYHIADPQGFSPTAVGHTCGQPALAVRSSGETDIVPADCENLGLGYLWSPTGAPGTWSLVQLANFGY